MTDTPPDWVLIEAAKRSGWDNAVDTLRHTYFNNATYRALCDMIQKYEQPPVDRKLLCAEEALFDMEREVAKNAPYKVTAKHVAIRAIELYLEGFGE